MSYVSFGKCEACGLCPLRAPDGTYSFHRKRILFLTRAINYLARLKEVDLTLVDGHKCNGSRRCIISQHDGTGRDGVTRIERN